MHADMRFTEHEAKHCGPRVPLLSAFLRRLRKAGGPIDLAYASARPGRLRQCAEALAAERFHVLEASDQPDVADDVLTAAAAAAAQRGPCEFVVVSCDADFAVVADHGSVTVLATRPKHVAQRLRARAEEVVRFQAPGTRPGRRRRRVTAARKRLADGGRAVAEAPAPVPEQIVTQPSPAG